MAKYVPATAASGYLSTTQINQNFTDAATAFENTLSRDGTTPNSMSADLDMGSNQLINVGAPTNPTDGARLKDLTDSSVTIGTTTALLTTISDSGTYYASANVEGALAEVGNLVGVTSTVTELNLLDGVTSTTAEINILDGVTSTATEINILDGVTSTTAEINLLDGVTATTAEINYIDGVTSDLQTQLNAITASIIFTESFESTNQTITSAGTLTIAHGLSAQPKLYNAYLENTTSELGYSIGDEVSVTGAMDSFANVGVSIVPDATNLVCRFGSAANAFEILHKGTGVSTNITNASWKLILRAYG